MKILTNDKNPAVLKLLVSANIANTQVPCEKVSFGGKRMHMFFSLVRKVIKFEAGFVLHNS